MTLNPADSLAADVWARLVRGDINSASIGFVPVEGDWVEVADNSLDADPDNDEDIEVFAITRAELIEVSLVAQGAFAGATSAPAAGRLAADIVADTRAVPGGAEDTPGLELRGAMPMGAIVGGDDTEPATDEGAPDDAAEGDTGDVAGGVGEDFGGAAEPDGDGGGEPAEREEGQTEGAEAEAERQGLTLKEIIGQSPYQLRRLLE